MQPLFHKRSLNLLPFSYTCSRTLNLQFSSKHFPCSWWHYNLMEKENMLKTPPKVPTLAQKAEPTECKTPTPVQHQDQIDHNNSNELRKPVTPDRLRVPKAFKYPERYTSPTDLMISPVTKGLLARTKRGGAVLPPGKNQPKSLDMPLQDVGPFQNKLMMLIDEKINSA